MTSLAPNEIAEVLRTMVEDTPVWWLRDFLGAPGKRHCGWVSGTEFRLKPMLHYRDGAYGPIVHGRPVPGERQTVVLLRSTAPACLLLIALVLGLAVLALATHNHAAFFGLGFSLVVLHFVGQWIFRSEVERVEADVAALIAPAKPSASD